MKKDKRRTHAHKMDRRSKRYFAPKTIEEFLAMPEKLHNQWIATVSAVSKSRAHDISVPQAAREFGLSPRTLRRLGAPGLRKLPNGRYAAKPWDRLLRVITVITPEGLREVATRDSWQASLASSIRLRRNTISKLVTIRVCGSYQATTSSTQTATM